VPPLIRSKHFLHGRGFWRTQWEKAAAESERLDRFDIKNDGLRVFLAGVWTLAGGDFLHAHEVYATLPDTRILEAYDFLMRIRGFVHLRSNDAARVTAGGDHPNDILEFEDFLSFGEMLGPDAGERERFEFANTLRGRLLSARRRVAQFAKGVIERELKTGRAIGLRSPIAFGPGGLSHTTAAQCQTGRDRSRAALSLVLASQHYDVPIDPAELTRPFTMPAAGLNAYRNCRRFSMRPGEASPLRLNSYPKSTEPWAACFPDTACLSLRSTAG